MYKQIKIFTDGSCLGNPGPGGCAGILQYKKYIKEFSMGYYLTTNNRMELMATIIALKHLKTPCRINLYTDSQYVFYGITQWIYIWKKKCWNVNSSKKIKNIDLWNQLDKIIKLQIQIEWHWIKSHKGYSENERCDQLAKLAAKNPLHHDIFI